MKRSRRGWLLLGLMAPALQACMPRGPEENWPTKEPVRWILVERRYGEIASPKAAGDGSVNPDAVVLAFQPLYREDLTWEVIVSPEEHYVEVVGFSPVGPASPGEVVSATVRVGRAKAGQVYRLLAKPSQADIRVLGETQAVVTGQDTAVFRFTSCTSGRAGIVVGVERIGIDEWRKP